MILKESSRGKMNNCVQRSADGIQFERYEVYRNECLKVLGWEYCKLDTKLYDPAWHPFRLPGTKKY